MKEITQIVIEQFCRIVRPRSKRQISKKVKVIKDLKLRTKTSLEILV